MAYAGPFVLGEGRHAVDFYATDLAGVVEAMGSRTVLVDTTPPATTSNLSGTSGHSPWYISSVTVYLNATDATSGVASLVYRVDGGNWTPSASPFALADGVHLLESYATDVAGLVESTKSRTVSIDTVPPTTTAALSGTLGANGWYTSNVTVSLTATDATSGVANITYRVDGGTWFVYTGPFALTEGSHVLDYFSVDLAGLTEATHSQIIAIDMTPPSTTASVSGTAGANGWYVSNVIVSLSASDSESGIDNVYVRVDGGGWAVYTSPITMTDGTHLLEYYAVNNAGLAETSHSVPILVDTNPPTTFIWFSGTRGANGWYTSNVTARIDGGGWPVYSSPVTVTDGTHFFEFYAVNGAGLVDATLSVSLVVDTTPPASSISLAGTAGANGWYVSNVTVSLSASDATSGVANITYRVDRGAWLSYAGPFVLGEGSHAVDYFASDQAGLAEAAHTTTIAVDLTPPTTTASVSGTAGANGWYVSNVMARLSASDSGSGVANIYVQLDGGNWAIYAGPVTLTEGTHIVGYFAVDHAGLIEATHSLSVSVDTAPPTTTSSLSGTAGTNGWYTSNVTVSLTATDATSGVAAVNYRIDNGPWLRYPGPLVLR